MQQEHDGTNETGAAAVSQNSQAAAQGKNLLAEIEDEMIQVTASINVDDEIVHGTASVNQSVDSNPLDPKNGAGGMVKVTQYLQDEALPERAQSQLEHQKSRDALYVASKAEGVLTRNELRSCETNQVDDDEEEITANREEAKVTEGGLNGQEQLTETVHTMAVNHTVPNTAAPKRAESDDWDDGVQGEVGAAAMTEADKNISHGFSSDNVMMLRTSQDCIENPLKQTETEKTGSQVMYNPGATGELEFDQQRVEDFFSAENNDQPTPTQSQEPLIADALLQQEIEDGKSEEDEYSEDQDQVFNNEEAQQQKQETQQVLPANFESELEGPEIEQQQDQQFVLEADNDDDDQELEYLQEDGQEDDDEQYSEDKFLESNDLQEIQNQETANQDDKSEEKQYQQDDEVFDMTVNVEETLDAKEDELVEKETISEDKQSQEDQIESNIELKSLQKGTPKKAHKRFYAPASAMDAAVMDELERLIINLNHTAMANLKNDQFVMAKRLLFKAEQNLVQVDNQCAELMVATDSISDLGDENFAKRAGIGPLDALKNRLMGLTYNNLGCLCKQQQDFQGALVYLKKALHFESRLEDSEEEGRNIFETKLKRNLDEMMDADAKDLEFLQDLRTIQCNSAGTILNICAILSKLNRHKQAQEYAEQAIQKLRHSMRLTKQQVMQAQRRIGAAQDQLELAQRNAQDGDTQENSEIKQLQGTLEKHEVCKDDLENQWVNLATTAVIAHYNAAVELEFTSCWREALEQYEKAMKLAALAMKDQNPMSAKIKQAMTKMRMKVRNKVQLPEKLVLQGPSATSKIRKGSTIKAGKAGASQLSNINSNTKPNSTCKATPAALKDWQTSVNSARSSQFNQQLTQLKQQQQHSNRNQSKMAVNTTTTMQSNEFEIKDDTEKSPGLGGHEVLNFHPNASLDTTDNQPYHQISSFGESIEATSHQKPRKVGLRTVAKVRAGDDQQSPISLKKIINKLELTEKQEAMKQLQPKSKFRSQRAPNPLPSYRANSSTQQANHGDENSATISVLKERQHGYQPGTALHQIRTTSLPGSRISRNQAQRMTVNSAGINTDATDPSFLPSLVTNLNTKGKMGSTGGFLSTKNGNNRGNTVQGGREVQTPLNKHIDRIFNTGFPKTMRSVQQKALPGVNAPQWGWGTIQHPATIDESVYSVAPVNIDIKSTTLSTIQAGKHRRAGTIDASSTNAQTNKDLNMSPTRLQMQLSVAQERRLIEQGKRIGVNKSKREQDINFFLGHIKKQGMTAAKVKGKMSNRIASPAAKMTERMPMPTDLASIRAQVIMETTSAQLAGSAYLPSKLKKTLKQRQYVSQIKTMQKQLVKEQQIDLNSQLETAFQREMAAWKTERENQLCQKLKELTAEQARQQEALYLTQQQNSALSDEDARSSTAPAGTTQLFYQGLSEDQIAAGEVEQPEYAMSAEQAQEARSLKQDDSNQNSKLSEAGASVEIDEEEVGNCIVSPNPPQAMSKMMGQGQVELGQMSIMDENDGKVPQDDKGLGNGAGQSSQLPVSEYMSSLQNITNEHNMATDTLSGTQVQEVELDRRSNKQTENLEVEDVVSADTNNQAQNFKSYRTSSNIFQGECNVVGQDELYKNRSNAESAIQYASTQGAVGQANDRSQFQNVRTGQRIQNAKSQLEVTSNFDQVRNTNAILRVQHDSMAAVTPSNYNNGHSQEQHIAQVLDQVKASQVGASSIEGSQMTETVMTVKSDYVDGAGNNFNNNTLHEDTIDGWKVQKGSASRPGSRINGGTPDLTDGQETVVMGGHTTSHIGDGPIFIKKSTDFHTSNRRIKHIDSQSSLGGTRRGIRQFMISNQVSNDRNACLAGLSRPDSRQVSEFTTTTQEIRYNDSRILQAKRISLGRDSSQPTQQMKQKEVNGYDSMLQNSVAQKSELECGMYPSGLSMEADSAPDNISQVTEVVMPIPESFNVRKKATEKNLKKGETTPIANIIQSGQISLASGAPGATTFDMNIAENSAMAMVTPTSYMTPRPGLTSTTVIRKDTLDRQTLERSSQDTEKMMIKAPKHIQYSKQSNRRAPPMTSAAPSKAKNAKTNQQMEHLRYVAQLAKAPPVPGKKSPSNPLQVRMKKPSQPVTATTDQQQPQQAPIPAMIHVTQNQVAPANNSVTARSTLTSQQHGSSFRLSKGNGVPPKQMLTKSGDHRETVSNIQQMIQQENAVADRSNTPLDSNGQQKTEVVMDYTYMRNDDSPGEVIAPNTNYENCEEEQQQDFEEGDENATENSILDGAAGVTGTEDRVAKIAQKISKLNTTLLQFQKDNEETRKDPTLKSTHRSTASKQGLMSQKSRENYVTMPVMAQAIAAQQHQANVVPQKVQQLQEKRNLAQLQSAPGRSRMAAQMQKEKIEGTREMNSALSASASQHEPTSVQQPSEQIIHIGGMEGTQQDEASVGAETFTPRNINSPTTTQEQQMQ